MEKIYRKIALKALVDPRARVLFFASVLPFVLILIVGILIGVALKFRRR